MKWSDDEGCNRVLAVTAQPGSVEAGPVDWEKKIAKTVDALSNDTCDTKQRGHLCRLTGPYLDVCYCMVV